MKHKRLFFGRNTYLALWLFVLAQTAHAANTPLQKITLQLKWHHQFQFAGYYAAKEKGYYEQAGLDVDFLEGSPSIDVIHEVLVGHADYGVGTSELVLARYHGAPIVVLGVIFQHSPVKLVTLTESGIDNIHKLANRKIMIEPGSAELFAYLQQEGLPANRFTQVLLSSKLDDLINGNVDAMLIYDTDEPFSLQKLNKDYYQFSPRMSGIDFYGDNLFTLEQTLKANPEQVEAFRAASMRGWHYAMTHQEEIIHLIYQKHGNRHSLEHLRFEAKAICNLMQPELIVPGYMNAGRWQHIAQTYHKLGLLPDNFNTDSMLYFPNPQLETEKLKRQLFITFIALIILILITLAIWRIYLRVQATAHRLDTIFQYAPISMIVIDEANRIVKWNHEAQMLFGWSETEILGHSVLEIVHESALKHIHNLFAAIRKEGSIIRSENINLRKDGSSVLCEWLNTPFSDKNDQKRYILSMAKDMTEMKHIQTKIKYLAHFDYLTELPNHALFFDRVMQTLALAKYKNKHFALMIINLNIFDALKSIQNKNLSTELLKTAAQRIQDNIHITDTVSQAGGDVLSVLLATDIEDEQRAQQMSDNIRHALTTPFLIDGLSLTLNCSIGVAIYPRDGDNITTLTQHADIAMYQDQKTTSNLKE